MKTIALILALVAAGSAAQAKDCSYCGKLEALKSEFRKVKPEPMNADTIDLQDELLGKTEELIKEISRKKPEAQDLERIVGMLAVAVPFDYSESLGTSLNATYKPFLEKLYAEVKRQEKAKQLSGEQAKEIIINIAQGEVTVEEGTDSKSD